MGKNKQSKKAYQTPVLTPLGSVAVEKQPEAPKFVEKIVGLLVRAPEEWPEAKRRLFTTVERSLLEKPEFARLSVMPEGCLFTLFKLVPANDDQAAVAA